MESITHVIGIDISLEYLDASWCDQTGRCLGHVRVAQTKTGWRELVRKVCKGGVTGPQVRVVMEATSTYWMGAACYLHEQGMMVHVVNPKHAHHYAKSYHRHHKTDKVDAELLMRMGYERGAQLLSWTPPPACYEPLYQLLVLRDQWMEEKVRFKNRLHALKHRPGGTNEVVKTHIQEHLKWLTAKIAQADKQLQELLTEGEWQQQADYLMSIPGVGLLTTAWLLIATVGFTTCVSVEQLVGYAGLAPADYESGKSVRKKSKLPPGGHARLRTCLFMAARSASVHNPRLKITYEQLLARGKLTKVAHCALARKLLVIAYALVTKEQYYDPAFHLQAQLAA